MSKLQDVVDQLKALLAKGELDCHPIQESIAQVSLENALDILSSEKSFFSTRSTNLLLWEEAVKSAEKEILALATDRGGATGHGFTRSKRQIELQRDLIGNNGVKISRLFAVNETTYNDLTFMDILRSQMEIGIDVWVARNNLSEYLQFHHDFDQENFIIIDETLLYRSYVDGGVARNTVSFDTELIKKYKKMYQDMQGYSTQFGEEDLPRAYSSI